jgi:diacylglycerol kinase family enzyme
MKKVLFVNATAGRAKKGKELDNLLAEAGKIPDLEVHIIERGDNLPWQVKNYLRQDVKIFGVAGGDGTVNSVASCLVNINIPLVVVPFGTLNHFARDIGVPPTPVEAVRLFEDTGATEIRIDVGEVNGNYFLNNSSIGIYPRLVKQREKYEARLGKLFAYLLAGWNVLRRPNLLHVRLQINGEKQDIKVGLLFFSNNRINMTPLQAGQRARLDDQIFDVYLVKAGTFFELFRVAASFLRNKLVESPLVTQAGVCEATVYTSRHHLPVAFDGETRNLTSPLEYKIHPAALLVRVLPEKVEKGLDAAKGEKDETQAKQTGVA